MCLAIPGQVVEAADAERQTARVDVGGVRRRIHLGLVDDGPVKVGDWVLVHVGFAISRIDEAEARATLRALEEIGRAYREELEELRGSRIDE